uniref:Ion transport domain-containing protein n=1 Tax=Clytia hemisphaerica TaxID=252671 RepID=A0A7M5V7V5_9CNID
MFGASMDISAVPKLKTNLFAEQQRALMDAEPVDNSCKGRYLHVRRKVYVFLERPNSNIAISYHLMNLVLILGSIVTSILSTIDTYEDSTTLKNLILYYELALLSWFSVEYIARLWSCSYLGKYKGLCGRIRFMKTLYMAIDLFVIISTLVTAILSVQTAYFTILRITRFLQIFRILRLDRQRGDLRTMGRVVYKHRKELVTCYFVGFIILFGGTYLIYIIEKSGAEASTIDNMANGLYWAMITVTSVGYGDISPETWAGKLLTGVFALVGCAFFALPAGILGSGFALQVAKQKKQKRYIKVRNPAAVVLQTFWRNYSVMPKKYQLQATWHYFFPQILGRTNRPEYYEHLPGVQNIFKTDVFAGFHFDEIETETTKDKVKSFFKRSKKRQGRPINGSVGSTLESIKNNNDLAHHRRTSLNNRIRKISHMSRKKSSQPEMALSSLLNKQYKEAIRFVLKVKLFNSIKHFKNVRYPFVNVQDIMEKNALCHTETLSYLKHIQESLQEFRQEIKEIRLVIATQKNLSLPEENDEDEGEGDVLYSGFLAPDFHKPRRISTASNPTSPDESSADEQVLSGDETLKVVTVND